MSLPASLDSARGGRGRLIALALLVIVGAGLGFAAAYQVMNGSMIAALCLVPYLGVLCATWWLSRGNVLITVLVAYLIAPSPADNVLPQVLIFASTDFSLRPRDLLFLADLVLLAALLLIRPPLPASRLARVWLGCLLVLAAYPVVVGLLIGAGQSVPAIIQGAMMPLRGVALVVLVAWWAKTRGWDDAVRDLARTVVLAGALIAAGELAIVLLAGGEPNFSLAGYPLVTDGRPAVPGWGNNILANFFCTCLATISFVGHRLRWRLLWRVLLSLLLVLGLAYTEVRIAMVVALILIEMPVVLAVIRKLWPKRGGIVALLGGGVTGAVLGLTSVTMLYKLNPRFATLVPGFIEKYVANSGGGGVPIVLDQETGTDLGAASISTRGSLIRAALGVWERNPIIGTGWNGWGWGKGDPSLGDFQQIVAVDPHNGFTWLLADAGILGLLLLYTVPLIFAWRRWDLWWLLAVPGVATVLEMVNPNLRNGHFAVVVWAFIAVAFAAAPLQRRYTIRQWLRDAWNWLRGREVRPAEETNVSIEPAAVARAAANPEASLR